MAYRIAICDDSREDAGYSLLLAKEWAAARSEEVACEIFPSAESFLFRFEEDKGFDILLLDIEMGRMDGVELAGSRGDILWNLDKNADIRFSHENPSIQVLYNEFLGQPLSELSHHLLHTDQKTWTL